MAAMVGGSRHSIVITPSLDLSDGPVASWPLVFWLPAGREGIARPSLMLRGFPGWPEIHISERMDSRNVAIDRFPPLPPPKCPKRGSASLQDACNLSAPLLRTARHENSRIFQGSLNPLLGEGEGG